MAQGSDLSLIDTNTGGKISQALVLRDAWGNWLTELGDGAGGWDWWVSLTFRDQHDGMTGHWNKAGWAFTGSAWCWWLRVLEQMRFATMPIDEITTMKPISWVRCRETQKGRGVDHFHALLAHCGDIRRSDAWRWWFNKYGIARIVPYDRNLGAGHYLCKYVTKELGDIQFSEGLTLRD
ncbi:hypothetical protein ES703_120951 [subsurface metagenome]